MSTARLRAVAAPAPVPVTATRAAAVYPQSEYLAARWLAAARWMQTRPQGSVWLLDRNSAPAKWRAITEDVA